MALGTFAAGAYTSSYTHPSVSAASLGITRDGYTISWRQSEEVLDKSDVYGRTEIETFHLGLQVSISAIFHEWRQSIINLSTPQTAGAVLKPLTAGYLGNGIVGILGTAQAGALVLTATANTPAATNGWATVTIPYVKLANDFPVDILLAPEHRTVPFRGRIFPYEDSTIVKFFSQT